MRISASRMGIILAVRLSARDAIIPPDKLRAYLLSVAHPDGRGKAEYLGRLGWLVTVIPAEKP